MSEGVSEGASKSGTSHSCNDEAAMLEKSLVSIIINKRLFKTEQLNMFFKVIGMQAPAHQSSMVAEVIAKLRGDMNLPA